MNEPTHPLTNEAPVVETAQAPVTPEDIAIPEVPEKNTPPCSAVAPHQLATPEDADLVSAVQKLSGKFPNVDPNLLTCLIKEIQSMTGYRKPAEPTAAEPATCGVATIINMAPAIRAGRFGMKEIVEIGLGFNYAEFKADLKRLYSHQSNTLTIIAMQNAFRNKYGLNITLEGALLNDDDETYWRLKLAAAVEKVEKNQLEVGDEVVILTANHNFGKVATLMNLTNEEATVIVDNIANNPLIVGAPFVNLKLLTGTEKQAMLQIGTVTAKYLPEGLRPDTLAAWHRALGQYIYTSNLPGMEPITLHRVLNASQTCEHKGCLGDFSKEVNAENLVSIYGRIADVSTVAAIKVTPVNGQTDFAARTAVADILDEMVSDRTITDIKVRFSGSTGYYIVVSFNNMAKIKTHQDRIQAMITPYLENSKVGFVLGATTKPNAISIATDVRTVPAAYSVNQDTGLVCVPLDPMKLSDFDPKRATISQLSEAYGLGITA
jgi:hypothetical protein